MTGTPNQPIAREKPDPREQARPLPWYIVMLLGAMTMWGAFYIATTPSGGDSALGDQRSIAALEPRVQAPSGADGRALFGEKCAACHQPSGLGVPGVFPPLAGSEWVLGGEKTLIGIVLHGVTGDLVVKSQKYSGAMPAFASLSDAEIAAILTHIRSEWGNRAAPVAAGAVQSVRAATRERTAPFAGAAELGEAK
jgi:mono/diheme cytochrome c family protein